MLVLLFIVVLSGLLGPSSRAQGDPVIAAAGDIACDPADESFNGGLEPRTPAG